MIKVLAGVLALALLAACTANPQHGDTDTVAAQCDPRLDAGFRAWAQAGFSGSVAISSGGRFECLAGYGSTNDAAGVPNTSETVFDIGSVTKAFTAAAVFDLVEDGKLKLDDHVGALLPEVTGPVARATVRQLLHHTSGLNGSHGNDYEPLGRDAAVAAINGLQLVREPGTGHLYSNTGYTLLALIIEKVSGMSYREHAAARILRLPDGRTAGGFWNGEPAAPGPRAVGYLANGHTGQSGDFQGPHWAIDGNGGLAMTARDLAAWTRALFTGQIVAPESAKAIATPGFDLGEGKAETPGWVAYHESVYGKPFLATAGGGGGVGHNVVVTWIPDGERVVVITSNKPKVSAENLLQKVGPALIAGQPLPLPDHPAGDSGAPDLAAMAGRYTVDTGGSFDVTAKDNRLEISASGADAIAALFPPRDRGADLRGHERRVADLLAGRTDEGRKERAAIEGSIGPIDDVRVVGTVITDNEPHTYVTISSGARQVIGWYCLDEEGGIQGAEVPTSPPALRLVARNGAFRPDDPAGTGPEVTVEFGGGRMTITGPAATTRATRAG